MINKKDECHIKKCIPSIIPITLELLPKINLCVDKPEIHLLNNAICKPVECSKSKSKKKSYRHKKKCYHRKKHCRHRKKHRHKKHKKCKCKKKCKKRCKKRCKKHCKKHCKKKCKNKCNK